MRSSRLINSLLLILALGSVLNVFSQEIRFTHEIEGHEFYGQGRLKGIALKTSTRDDVKLAFGSDCDWTYCNYNDNWDVMFVYLESFWRERDVKGDYEFELAPSPEFIDRLLIIQFQAKKSSPLSPGAFTDTFEKEPANMIHSGTAVLYYRDKKGLVYTVLDEGESKGNLLNITYHVPVSDRKEMFFVIGQKHKHDIDQPRLIQN